MGSYNGTPILFFVNILPFLRRYLDVQLSCIILMNRYANVLQLSLKWPLDILSFLLLSNCYSLRQYSFCSYISILQSGQE